MARMTPARMEVKYSYLQSQFADSEDILDSIRGLLRTGLFTLGPQVGEFEARFAARCGVKYAVGLNSGTDALFLALKALGVGPGDEVITAPNSFFATAGAIAQAGARPVFADVNEEYNLDPRSAEAAITTRTKALMPVHLTGNPADMEAIGAIARRHNLHVVEDTAQAVGASINGKPVGGFGAAAGFSLHPLKNLNVWGDGGVLVTDSEAIYRKVMLLRNHGLRNRDEIECFGYNSRLDTLQAIVGLHLLEEVGEITEKRIRNARAYDEAFADLADFVKVPPRRPGVRQVFHTYVVLVKDRERLIPYLAGRGVETKVHYPIPIHLQDGAKYLGYKRGDFPVCEAQAATILTLPVHQDLAPDQLEHVAGSIRQFYLG